VILAKIGKASFHRLVRPGDTLRFIAKIDSLDEHGASISGLVKVDNDLVAEIEMMFSHIDKNLAGIEFPEHNFVFTEQFTELIKTYKLGGTIKL
jgi:3-hydroxyacyl-[acyl-carrier-protein] dehydratase